ncbi:MAG: ATP-binding cassette domain-containing protein [Halofilum sp. (in: g-proteobacteria)]|nr:ATP-binding cassette domain-containing protein [Halofilum sp. (in: g-proteobacteria)]
MTVLALEDACAAYGGQRAIGPVTLTVREGEHVALVGRSGAGKSTLLSLLFDPGRRELALMPQELGLVQTLSVFHNVYMGRLAAHTAWYNVANLVRPFAREIDGVGAVLDTLGMRAKLWSRVGELSGGQRQRTAVARALYQQASVLLADEPVSALDVTRAEDVMRTITSAYATAVIAMHDVELALRHCSRIVGIDAGRVALDEPAHRLSVQDLLPLYDYERAAG